MDIIGSFRKGANRAAQLPVLVPVHWQKLRVLLFFARMWSVELSLLETLHSRPGLQTHWLSPDFLFLLIFSIQYKSSYFSSHISYERFQCCAPSPLKYFKHSNIDAWRMKSGQVLHSRSFRFPAMRITSPSKILKTKFGIPSVLILALLRSISPQLGQPCCYTYITRCCRPHTSRQYGKHWLPNTLPLVSQFVWLLRSYLRNQYHFTEIWWLISDVVQYKHSKGMYQYFMFLKLPSVQKILGHCDLFDRSEQYHHFQKEYTDMYRFVVIPDGHITSSMFYSQYYCHPINLKALHNHEPNLQQSIHIKGNQEVPVFTHETF